MKVGNSREQKLNVRVASWDYQGIMGVWLWQRKPDGHIYVARFDKGRFIFEDGGHEASVSNPDPTFAIPMELAQDFRKSMMAALQEFGVEIPSESKLAGKLEATETHLADMRALVFATAAPK